MGYKCSAYGCKSGYEKDKSEVTLHKFPDDERLRDAWIRAVPRRDMPVTPCSRLCSKHFQPSDFVEFSQDTHPTRKKKCSNRKLQKRYLKPDAVPTIFENVAKYLSKSKVPKPRVNAPTADRRCELESAQLDKFIIEFNKNDNLKDHSLTEIVSRIKDEKLPLGFQVYLDENKGCIYIFSISEVNEIPVLQCSLVINSDMTFKLVAKQNIIDISRYSDIAANKVSKLSEIVNLLARLKAISEESTVTVQTAVQSAIANLERSIDDASGADPAIVQKIKFIVEQLYLTMQNKFCRHYTPELTVLSFLVYSASPAGYDALKSSDLLCLPSVSTLKKVTRIIRQRNDIDNTAYLRLRKSKLNQYEKCVILIIDEIYVAKRVEYSGGMIHGLTKDGLVASTMLCFMVKSLSSQYKDIVAIYPIANLTSAVLNECYDEVIKLIQTVGFEIVCVSVDNATANRKFFIDHLCGGNLRTFYIDRETNKPVYLIFDPVHDLKNVYNNFQARKTFECPAFSPILPDGCTARFSDICDIFKVESTMQLKKAHRLRQATLSPKSIEKVSVKLALSVFCESTRNALLYYSEMEGYPWKSTSDFISAILKLWNVMNVKTKTKGFHKRDDTQEPIMSSTDPRLEYLHKFAEFLSVWEDSKQPGLSKPTFLALRHTCLALADCASYLIEKCGYRFVLLGQLQSDALESRFGWLRQLSGKF